ncbi:hypothetical protein D3C81_1959390 [compost metagenome]
MLLFQVLADDAGVGEGDIAVAHRGNPPQGAQLAEPGGLAEGGDDFELVVQALLQQVETYLAHEGGQRGAVEGQAHREVLV